jgi:hypothetical protein
MGALQSLRQRVVAKNVQREDVERQLSCLYEEIAELVPLTSEEGAIARREAVRSAVAGGTLDRAVNLVVFCSGEVGATLGFLAELVALLPAEQRLKLQQPWK